MCQMILPVEREDSIQNLPLSARTREALLNLGLHTVGVLLDCPEELWKSAALGKRSTSELLAVIEQIRKGTLCCRITVPGIPARLPDVDLLTLHLGKRLTASLEKAGITSLADLSGHTEASLAEAGIPEKGIQDILDKLNQYLEANPVEPFPTPQQSALLCRTVSEISEYTGIARRAVALSIAALDLPLPDNVDEAYMDRIYALSNIRQAAENTLVEQLRQAGAGFSKSALLNRMPAGTGMDTLNELLDELEEQDKVAITGGVVESAPPSALDFALSIPDSRRREVLLGRLRGITLEEIGTHFGITRERARQITKAVLSTRPKLREDKYLDMFGKYEFSLEDFTMAFDEPPESYRYLELLRKRGEPRQKIHEMIDDETIPLKYRLKVERAVFKNYVLVDGVRVQRSSAALARHTVMHHCIELTSMEQFMEKYRMVLAQCGLENDPAFDIEARTYENKLNSCDYALWNQWRSFRRYIMADYDFTLLLDTLSLETLEDQELSAMKYFRDYPELMKLYDIRDEYELHNLLKKVWDRGDRVHFKKMPTIEIGHPNRDEQVRALLMQNAPITNLDLALKYEELYGAKSFTAMINYFKCIDCYLANGMYRIDLPGLPEERKQHMKRVLTEDFYRLSELKVIYLQEFPGSDPNDLNSYALKELGFRIYTEYVVNRRFPSATAYFRQKLLGDGAGYSDMREAARRYTGIVAYSSELYNMKADREIVEYEPSLYVSVEQLEAHGIPAAQLEDYCAAVCQFANDNGLSYFTVTSLRTNGFHHPLEDRDFQEWFFSSLLTEDRERFSSQRMGKTRVFRTGDQEVRLEDFFRTVLSSCGKMDLNTFQTILIRDYGFSMQPDKIITVIRNSDLYFDQVERVIYTDIESLLNNLRP